MPNELEAPVRTIAVIGNALPRQCGIATYTTDLCTAINTAYPTSEVFVVAMNDTAEGYDYPNLVRFEVPQHDKSAYRQTAEALNLANVDLVCVQHEYGIFGGSSGSHLLTLLRNVRAPIITTLHTILRDPTIEQRKVLIELAQLSNRLVVMSTRAAAFLRDLYGVAAEKIDLIPHGIPDLPFLDSSFHKDRFNAEGKMVLLTFGLLSQNKGIEHVIAAMPTILKHHPNVVYMVLGTTHPQVRKHEGERYRLMLQRLAHDLAVDEQVVFYDQFVTLDELVQFIGAADIYITPYVNPAQIVSGTLAYTVGAGKAIISTPYWYAEEMLADGCGILVPSRDSHAIATQVLELLDNEAERHAMRKRAYLLGRTMTWPLVAARYMASFQQARREHRHSARTLRFALAQPVVGHELPPLQLDHLHRMTDSTGMVQHAIFSVPNYNEGYATDDNARALIAAVLLEERGVAEAEPLAMCYMAFLWHAFQQEHGRFRNFLGFDRRWQEEVGSEDSHARAVWALGTVLARSCNLALVGSASSLFAQALLAPLAFAHPRPWAFTLLGLHAYLQRFPGHRPSQRLVGDLAERLLARYQLHRADGWHWFEDMLSYDNAVLPHALLLAGEILGRADMREAGLEALRWLVSLQHGTEDYFTPVGCHGFYQRGAVPARFDQQPLEAQATVLSTLDAHRLTGDDMWYNEAHCAFAWFLGRNDLHLPLYNAVTGGCHDGLLVDRVNQNQGAESTLAFLLASMELGRAQAGLKTRPGHATVVFPLANGMVAR
ncbi:MAG: glycosyltransferase family 4 protein [Chloroflexaceae bacterium]|jgi:glycosyltransferase involved in cell wall biosynthesis|nr:glycosyltransferase family 4 protein [Chloroflexaceae bacterium]